MGNKKKCVILARALATGNTATHACVTAHKTMSCRVNGYSISPICSRYICSHVDSTMYFYIITYVAIFYNSKYGIMFITLQLDSLILICS